MKFKIFIFSIFLCSISIAGGSIYSRFGLGTLRFSTVDKTAGLGGLGIALFDPIYINRYNPALWSELARVRISGGYLYEGTAMQDKVKNTFLTSGNFDGVLFAIPLWKRHGLTFATGVMPFSTVNYSIKKDSVLENRYFSQSYKGEGGISSFILGFSFRPFNKLSFGVRGEYYFGTIVNLWEADFGSSEFFFSSIRRERNYGGFGFTLGLAYGLGIGKNSLTVGFVFSSPVNLKGLTTVEYSVPVVGSSTVSEVNELTSQLPYRAGFGFSYFIGDRVQFSSDVYYQNWEKFRINGEHPKEITNAVRVGAGLEILPSREVIAGFFEKTSYRFGIFYNKTYFKINEKQVNELFFAVGFGFPVSFDTRVNLSIEYGFRGDLDIVRDRILRISIGVNTGEIWFVKQKLED
ncbi:hypothetical protein JGI7_01812 [Candidatus Kryptonium thompsonii]|uniref:Long-chain fatty acid transport protein n=1 Tax=Candidatus Kryptonium thompsonii TaxID=1633631 RepID=A0A0P1L780_9BACT|nr:hypothetical protein [Candidatus Kryptonium thompsoni]CUS76940.1 hypothetical protein JGI15_100164 [Candidatus Kryptonium thompsoni]CUS79446.1 hypothetical protein JGI10_00399 [Candidatus Kryptonium thompsoni]CUS80622.1 hypothetical protein JGI14_100828 [Candidatus Kryptonium thompsoni]CUS81070.1 hypothetical protein JGI16_10332 [Candidatus Kryptonium thompsoni]CUS93388.1 hypothetical protein JGI7_01812 [Candidatus Kryptonium thompsoni]